MRSRCVSSASKSLDCVVAHRSDRYPSVRPVRCCCTSVFRSSVLALWINQGTQWFSGEPPETPRTRCSLRQSPLMTRLPRNPGLTLVLRLNQETVHDFILLFLPPCGPHLTSLATGVGHTRRVLMQGRKKTDSYWNSLVILLGLVPCNPTRTPAL
jgi:hypothetical protein